MSRRRESTILTRHSRATEARLTRQKENHVSRDPNLSTAASVQRRCPGVPSMGRPEHFISVAEFASNKARPDGLSRLCKPCSKAYTSFRAGKAQVEAVLGPISEPLSEAEAHPMNIAAAAERLGMTELALARQQAGLPLTCPNCGYLEDEACALCASFGAHDGPCYHGDASGGERAVLEQELENVGGAGSEAGQAMLLEASKRSAEGRRLYQREQKRAERARKKAAAA